MKLSKLQEEALERMELGKWYSAYGLQVSLGTLEALGRKGKVKVRRGLGSIFSPRTEIKFMKVKQK